MKRAGILVALATFASVLLSGLGFWTLTKIESDLLGDVEDDASCCNSGLTDCCC